LSSAGSYTVLYSLPSSGSCPSVIVTTSVEVGAAASANITYAAASFCTSDSSQAALLSGTGNFAGGTFSFAPAGLSLDPGTGEILPSASQPGVYTVTYTLNSVSACPGITTSTVIEIIETPAVLLTYSLSTIYCLQSFRAQEIIQVACFLLRQLDFRLIQHQEV
jgi:hypothetical protein